jgi:hypothetical protein
MKDHIDNFTKAVYLRDQCRPDRVDRLGDVLTNALFLVSLGKEYLQFSQSMDGDVETIKPGQLYFRAIQCEQRQLQNETDPTRPPENLLEANTFRKEGKRGKSGKKKTGQKQGKPKRAGGNKGKFCTYCKTRGHEKFECLKKIKADEKKAKKRDDDNSSEHEYGQDNTSYVIQINQTSRSEANPNKWVVDSAANANTTPFLHRLHDYRPFVELKRSKALADIFVSAVGSGTVILTDAFGRKHTIKGVLRSPK